MNEDVPIEAVLKYIVRERDGYKEKLEHLINYTKSLENEVKTLRADAGSFTKAVNELRGEYEAKVAQIKKKCRAQKKQLEMVIENLNVICENSS